MKQLLSLVSLVALLLCLSLPSHAVVELIKQGATSPGIQFLLVDTATGQVGQTGQAGNVVIKLRKSGGTGAGSAGTVAEIDAVNFPGVYEYTPTSTETNTLGILTLDVTCTGCQRNEYTVQIVAFDPNDPSLLGLTGVATASAQATNATAVSAIKLQTDKLQYDGSNYVKSNVQTGTVTSVGSVTGGVTLAAGQLPTTYPLSVADELVLANLTAMIQGTGNTLAFKTTALANAPAGNGQGGDPFAGVKTGTTYATGTWGSFLAAQLANAVPADYQQRGVAVTLPASVVPAGDVTTIANASATATVNSSVASGVSLAQAVLLSMHNLKSYQSALNTVAHTRTVTYFVPGTTDAAASAGTGTPLFTATTHYATDNSTLLWISYN